MEHTRLFAGAFLRWENEVILIKRGLHKKIAPGLWSGIGGHIEQHEMNTPKLACLREIEEETGIRAAQIKGLDMRYFILRKSAETLDSIYYFVGELQKKCSLAQTDEGVLHWVTLEEGRSLEMTACIKKVYSHWIKNLDSETLHCWVDSTIPMLNGGENVPILLF